MLQRSRKGKPCIHHGQWCCFDHDGPTSKPRFYGGIQLAPDRQLDILTIHKEFETWRRNDCNAPRSAEWRCNHNYSAHHLFSNYAKHILVFSYQDRDSDHYNYYFYPYHNYFFVNDHFAPSYNQQPLRRWDCYRLSDRYLHDHHDFNA